MNTRRGGIKKGRESVKSEACIGLVGCEEITTQVFFFFLSWTRRAHKLRVHRFFGMESRKDINHSTSE